MSCKDFLTGPACLFNDDPTPEENSTPDVNPGLTASVTTKKKIQSQQRRKRHNNECTPIMVVGLVFGPST